MTFTYDTSILQDPLHEEFSLVKARLVIGDTVEEHALLDDDEIRVHLADAPNFYEGVARAIESILARYSNEASFSVGNMRVDLERRAERARQLAKTVRDQKHIDQTRRGAPEAMTPWTNGFFRPGRYTGTSDIYPRV